VLFTATNFLLPSLISEIIATEDGSNSGADSVTFIYFDCVRTGALVAVSSLFWLPLIIICSRLIKSSLEELVFIVSLSC
jgi:hypothetical protein